ncbi:MAG: hypothetical protein E7582_02590 [Ruminococcaceae bacterium]|nr:hypothetical protein [Oscillospiraceae bacterium]
MEKEIQLLNKIYWGTEIGSKALNALLPKVNNPPLRRAIITQINEYDKINSDAKYQISALGKKAKKNLFSTASAIMESKMNSAVNSSPSHIAEMIIKGSNMGIINITKELNRATFCSPTTYNLGKKLVKTEEENVTRIKSFL